MYDFYRHCRAPPKIKMYEFDMKVGDSVRVYDADDRFYEGRITCVISEKRKIKQIQVDWDEWRSWYTVDELELEYKEGPCCNFTIVSKDGEEKAIQCQDTTICDEQGNVTTILIFTHFDDFAKSH